MMHGTKRDDFNARREAADLARKAMIDRFRAQPRVDDPIVQERLAAQRAAAEIREGHRAQRRAEAEARAEAIATEARRLEAEQAARQAEEARLAAEETERQAEAERDAAQAALTLAAEQKAKRDARYAARQARRK
ncbi:DUF6481 family protein [Sabulicella rubraurantiaca]|uniref:DUF6481 family protein n=1 Tax=Sabulicella rubraurantiaca TaxID=2811429 RepID=UPI001F40C8A4|nr:DUF6481 family protein [Sabulicella rubraurantiaca]